MTNSGAFTPTVSMLEDYLLQYANRSILEILMPLKTTYDFRNPTQFADNYNKMTASINFQDPIETLFKQIEDVFRYANDGIQPHMEANYVNINFLLILNTGTVLKACRDWQHRTPVNKTWGDFRREFARAQREQRIISNTTSDTGYHTANVAQHYMHGQLPADGVFVTAMANLATTTSTDPETVTTLTNAIATITHQLAAKDIWTKSKEAEIKLLLGGRVPVVAAFDARPADAYARKSYKTKNFNYCWSHGYQVELAHTSANCTKKSPGQDDEATKDNVMGGEIWGGEFI
jgi:hypothetical protein